MSVLSRWGGVSVVCWRFGVCFVTLGRRERDVLETWCPICHAGEERELTWIVTLRS